MTPYRIITSAPDRWTMPRPTRDPMGNKYAKLLPMEPERRGFWARVWGRG